MNPWSNIQVTPEDHEILMIDKFGLDLGAIPEKVTRIRELITRFEVCHFKYEQHLKKIRDSITRLDPVVDTGKIGMYHIQHGEAAAEKDKTGKSPMGQEYVHALKDWLGEGGQYTYDTKLKKGIHKWLGRKDPEKERLVRLLLARLTWDWGSYEKLKTGQIFSDIEDQASRMDICHYAFPGNLDEMLRGIGQLKAVKGFEGCGSYSPVIRSRLEKEFKKIMIRIEGLQHDGSYSGSDRIRIWLFACLAKTIKENIGLQENINIRQHSGKK